MNQVAGLRFFFVRTLKRRFPPDAESRRGNSRAIEAVGNLQARAILMALSFTAVPRREFVSLRVR